MIRLITIALLFALLQPAPAFQARWDTATSATISWQSPAFACLSREPLSGGSVFIGCWDGPAKIGLGHVGPLSGDARPMAGDVFKLVTGGQVFSAPLVARSIYLPVWRGVNERGPELHRLGGVLSRFTRPH